MAVIDPDIEEEIPQEPQEEVPEEREEEQEQKQEQPKHSIVDRAKEAKDQYDDFKNRVRDLKEQFSPKDEEPTTAKETKDLEKQPKTSKPLDEGGELGETGEAAAEAGEVATADKAKIDGIKAVKKVATSGAKKVGTGAGEAAGEVAGAGEATAAAGAEALGVAATEAGAVTVAGGTAAGVAAGAAAGGAAVAGGAAAGAEAGAAIGTVGGPVGNVVGAAVGAAVAIAGTFLVKHGKGIIKSVVIGFLFIALIIIIVIALIAGKNVPIKPTTANQKQAAEVAAASAGDSNSLQKVTNSVIQAQKARYQMIQSWVNQSDASASSNLESQITQLNSLMNQDLAETNASSKQNTTSQIIKMMATTDSSLPFGNEISTLAQADVGKPDKNFCNVSSAFSSSSCTNFIYDVLYQAGVPGVVVTNDTELWNDPSLTKVINRQDSLSYTDLSFTGKLKPGDIVFFGDGTFGATYDGALFDHAGIYIGNNMMVDSNSNTGNVTKESIGMQTTSGIYAFNGAERYGN